MANKNTPAVVDADEFTKKLLAAGFLNKSGGGNDFNRITAKGGNVVFDKKVIASYNEATKEPALIVQIADMPTEYQSMWFTKELATAVGRDGSIPGVADISNRFCKSHFEDPNEARKYSEDGTSCEQCPVMPYKSYESLPEAAKRQDGASKCAWKADIEFYILEKLEDGTFKMEDETLYTMSLPTTGVIEFKGSSSRKSNPLAGSVSAEHFMVQLAKLGMQKWGEEGLLKAHTYLRLGGVVAEMRLPMTETQDGSKTYNVTSFTPIEILEVTEQAKLPEKSPQELLDDIASITGGTIVEESEGVETDEVPF